MKIYKCYFCDATFSYGQKRATHVHENHKNSKMSEKFKCKYENCTAEFDIGYSLKKHEFNVHENEKPSNICHICNKVFKNSKHYINKHRLAKHIASVHEGKKPFSCNICNATFTVKKSMKNHISIYHYCDLCFIEVVNKKEHFKSVHEVIKVYNCDICQLTFAEKKLKENHTSKVHKCDICSMEVENKKKHIKSVHKKSKKLRRKRQKLGRKCPVPNCTYRSILSKGFYRGMYFCLKRCSLLKFVVPCPLEKLYILS